MRKFPLALLLSGGSFVLFVVVAVLAGQVFDPAADPLRELCTYDCAFYRSIAVEGYQLPRYSDGVWSGNYGFFIGFPAGVWLAMQATGLEFWAAGLVVNALYALGFCWLALNYRNELGLESEHDAIFFLAAFLLWPWSLYNHVPYSEMLFNLAALGTFVCWRRGQWAAAAAFGVVLTATRVTGIVLPLLLLAELVFQERRVLMALILRPDWRVRSLGVMPFGLMAAVFAIFSVTGDPLGYFRIQETAWNQGIRNPIDTAIASISVSGIVGQYQIVALILAVTLVATGMWLKRIPPLLGVFAIVAPALTLVSTYAAVARYALALFPVCLLINALPVSLRAIALIAMALVQAVFVYFWLGDAQWLI